MRATRQRLAMGCITWDPRSGSPKISDYILGLYPPSCLNAKSTRKFRDLSKNEQIAATSGDKGEFGNRKRKPKESDEQRDIVQTEAEEQDTHPEAAESMFEPQLRDESPTFHSRYPLPTIALPSSYYPLPPGTATCQNIYGIDEHGFILDDQENFSPLIESSSRSDQYSIHPAGAPTTPARKLRHVRRNDESDDEEGFSIQPSKRFRPALAEEGFDLSPPVFVPATKRRHAGKARRSIAHPRLLYAQANGRATLYEDIFVDDVAQICEATVRPHNFVYWGPPDALISANAFDYPQQQLIPDDALYHISAHSYVHPQQPLLQGDIVPLVANGNNVGNPIDLDNIDEQSFFLPEDVIALFQEQGCQNGFPNPFGSLNTPLKMQHFAEDNHYNFGLPTNVNGNNGPVFEGAITRNIEELPEEDVPAPQLLGKAATLGENQYRRAKHVQFNDEVDYNSPQLISSITEDSQDSMVQPVAHAAQKRKRTSDEAEDSAAPESSMTVRPIKRIRTQQSTPYPNAFGLMETQPNLNKPHSPPHAPQPPTRLEPPVAPFLIPHNDWKIPVKDKFNISFLERYADYDPEIYMPAIRAFEEWCVREYCEEHQIPYQQDFIAGSSSLLAGMKYEKAKVQEILDSL